MRSSTWRFITANKTAEKAVKAFLVYQRQPLEWTHDVRLLVARVLTHEPGFAEWLEAGTLVMADGLHQEAQACASPAT